ncbi:hypothetical protein EGR_02380 [Echinococcus granulosus]|uniref:Uncharacterized protein n=1 Tax=Echinococcus granulosus TaxID=6210 RepID=W6V8U9_ECHGR|nr:hypothetical protein EGR_02380 [Echinococcus granulosus]EUB62939.1 hypothetical protein EGR_02380 [Echinococcus granulosus]
MMSSQRGNTQRSRPQKYQNTSAFKNNMHDTSKKTALLNQLEMDGLCARCEAIIEWKIRYKKHKPLTKPRTWYVLFFSVALTHSHVTFHNSFIAVMKAMSDLPLKTIIIMYSQSCFSALDVVSEVLRGLTSPRVSSAFLPLIHVENAVRRLMPFLLCEFAP